MAVTTNVSWSSLDPDVYWFSLLDNSVLVVLTPASVVVVERQVGPSSWSSDLALQVAEHPDYPGTYCIRTTIPPQLANGQERILRITVDGTIYGPWSFRFWAPV